MTKLQTAKDTEKKRISVETILSEEIEKAAFWNSTLRLQRHLFYTLKSLKSFPPRRDGHNRMETPFVKSNNMK
jgi:hypothetical protein